MTKSNIGEGKTRKQAAASVKRPKKKQLVTPEKDAASVSEYMTALRHPLKPEIEEVRAIIQGVDSNIGERIKWNAPSYHYKGEDMVTFNLRADKHVHLVFHHPAIEKLVSPMLEGNYDKRRMTYFEDMASVKKGKKELVKIIKQLLDLI